MLRYYEVNKKYYEKFGKYIGVPVNGFSSDKQQQKYYERILECINQNREFNEGNDDSKEIFGELPDRAME